MPMSQERAALFDALQASPYLTHVVKDRFTNIDHLLLHSPWDGWFTPCGMPLAALPLKDTVRYGRPSCFECFDQEDPADAGRATRNVIKIRGMRRGQHWHVTMHVGPANGTLVNVGNLTLLEFEWREWVAVTVVGAMALGTRVMLEKEE